MAYSEAAYWLAALAVPALPRRVIKRMLYAWCLEGHRTAGDLFEAQAEEIAQMCAVTVEEARAILTARSSLERAQRALDELARWGAQVVTRADEAYPEDWARLEEEWQPYYAVFRGDLATLTEPGVAVLGATHPDAEAAGLAQALAQWLAKQGHYLVGGYDEGIDRLAIEAATAAGGPTVLVLAEGLLQNRPLLEATGEGALRLLLSPFAPEAPRRENQAVARRALILALCGAAFFLAPDEGPARWPLVSEFARGGLSLFMWQRGAESLPPEWVEIGARPFKGLEDLQYAEQASAAPLLPLREAEAESPEAPPIAFRDAQEAIARLGQTGKVPEKLAKRLRDALPKGSTE